MARDGCNWWEPWLDESKPWYERVKLYRECLQDEALAIVDGTEDVPYVELEAAERELRRLLSEGAIHMNDPRITLLGEKIEENARSLARHEEKFAYMQGRFDSIDSSHEKLRSSIEDIKHKIFNGYDAAIQTTKNEVSKIHGLVQDLYRDYVQHANRPHMGKTDVSELVTQIIREYDSEVPHMDKDTVKEITKAAISEYDSQIQRERQAEGKWWKHHKLEVIGAFAAISMIVSTVITILVVLGVIG